jgi:hypothetical protein
MAILQYNSRPSILLAWDDGHFILKDAKFIDREYILIHILRKE